MRRWILLIVLLVLTGLGTYRLFRPQEQATPRVDPWSALPLNTAIVVDLPHARSALDALTNSSLLWNDLGAFPSVVSWERLGQRLVNVFPEEQDPSILFGLVRQGGGTVASVVVVPLVGGPDPTAIQVEDLIDEKDLLQGNVVAIRVDSVLSDIHVTLVEKLLLLSSDRELIDEMRERVVSGSALFPTGLQAARATLARTADAHLMVRSEKAHRMLSGVVQADRLDRTEPIAGWCALDISIRPDAMLFSGLFLPEDSAIIGSRGAQELRNAWAAMPQIASFMDQRPAEGMIPLWRASLRDSSWLQLVEAGFSGVTCGSGADEQGGIMHWLVLGLEDTTRSQEMLRNRTGARAVHRGRSMISDPAAAGLAWGLVELPDPWCTIMDDRLIVASGQAALLRAIDAELDDRTLATDIRTMAIMERHAGKAQRTVWMDLGHGRDLLKAWCASDRVPDALFQPEPWDQLGGILFQVRQVERGRTYVTGSLQHAPVTRPLRQDLWTLTMSAPVARSPVVVRNHVNGTEEVVVVDSLHRMMLVGSNGKVLWERQLDGPMKSDPIQVDRYHNRKLQLLFNTDRSVYLIDRLGRDVEGFPIKLPASAAAPLAVFDYDNKHEERILVPLSDGRLLNHDLSGKEVKGWKAGDLGGKAIDRVYHIRNKGKDYLLTVLEDGKVRTLDRQGKDRYRPTLDLGPGATILDVEPGSDVGTCTILFLDGSGTVKEGTLKGMATAWEIGIVDAAAIVREGSDPQLVVIKEGRLILLGRSGPIWSVDGPFGCTDLRVFGKGKELLIQAGCASIERLHVFDGQGNVRAPENLRSIHPGPLADLDQDGSPELLLVTSDGKLIAHRLRR
ncbi:MAG: hypothetical protein KDB88_02695 [Flavobacteriales bacterium]|nr:hypothetical protein [Flavobacteriales bacterium]